MIVEATKTLGSIVKI